MTRCANNHYSGHAPATIEHGIFGSRRDSQSGKAAKVVTETANLIVRNISILI